MFDPASSSICGPPSACAFNNAFELPERSTALSLSALDAGAHKLGASSTVCLTSAKSAATPGFIGVNTQGLGLQRSTRELVPGVIVVSRAMRAFVASRARHFVSWRSAKIAVARFEREGSFLLLVAGAAHALLLFAFQLGGAQR